MSRRSRWEEGEVNSGVNFQAQRFRNEMARCGIGAINAGFGGDGGTRSGQRGDQEDVEETQEAQESRLRQKYAHVLRARAKGEVQEAKTAVLELLQAPMLAQPGDRNACFGNQEIPEDVKRQEEIQCSPVVRQLRFLVAKQAGELLELDGVASWQRAAKCFANALSVNGEDVGLWRKLGRICLQHGAVAAARNALEAGLACQPENPLLLQALLETLVEARDRIAAHRVARKLLEIDPGNPKAREAAEAPVAGNFDGNHWEEMYNRWRDLRQRKDKGDQETNQGTAIDKGMERNNRALGEIQESSPLESEGDDPFEPRTKCIDLPRLSWGALVTSLSAHVDAVAIYTGRASKRIRRGTIGSEETPSIETMLAAIPARVLFKVTLEHGGEERQNTPSKGMHDEEGRKVGFESEKEKSKEIGAPNSVGRTAVSHGSGAEKPPQQITTIREEAKDKEHDPDERDGCKSNRGTRISARLARQAQEETDVERSTQVELEDHPSQILSCFSPSLKEDICNSPADGLDAKLPDEEEAKPCGDFVPSEEEVSCVQQFLLQYDALHCLPGQGITSASGCNPFWLISGLLEKCVEGSVAMNYLPAESFHTLLQTEHLCRTGESIDPMRELAFAEMHADVALAKLGKRDSSMQIFERVYDAEYHLAAFQASEASTVLSGAWASSPNRKLNNAPHLARFLWTMACAAEAKRDRAKAASLYSKCARVCETLEDSSAAMPFSVKRKHCLMSPTLNATLAYSRAKALEIFATLQTAQEKVQTQSFDGVVEDLAPLLVPRFAPWLVCRTNGHSPKLPEGTLTAKERLDGLKTLQVAAEHNKEMNILVLFGSMLEQLSLSCSHFVSSLGRGKTEIFLKRRRRFANTVHSLISHLQRLSLGHLKGIEVILEAAEKAGLSHTLAQDVRRVVPGLVDALKWEVGAVTKPGVKVTQRRRKVETTMNHRGVSVDISCLLCTLHGLDLEHTIENPAACALLVDSVHSMLAEKGICCWSSGAALKCSIIQASLMKKKIMTKLMSTQNLSSLTEVRRLLREADEDGALSEDEAEDRLDQTVCTRNAKNTGVFSLAYAKALLHDLDRAVFQCIRCLYGVDLVGGSLQCHENVGSAQLNSKQACRDVWEQIHPLLADQPNRSSKMGEILTDISQQFPPLSDDQLHTETGVSIKAFLEEDVDEEMFLKGHSPPQLVPKESSEVVRQLNWEDRELYSSLYRYLQLVPSQSLENSDPGQLLDTTKAVEAINAMTRWLRVDLSFNPDSFDSWLQLAARYEEATDIILNDASLVWSPRQWSEKQELWALTKKFRSCARKCFLAARLCAPDIKSQCSAEEYLGQNLYEALQDSPPLCDFHTKPSWRALQSVHSGSAETVEVLSYTDPWDQSAWTSGIMFNLATKGYPHEWMYPYYRGKGVEKLIAHSSDASAFAINKRCIALVMYAHAARFARVYEGGLLEPFYRLHASRFKLLVPSSIRKTTPLHLSLLFPTRQEHKIGTPLVLLARHCFLPDTFEKISVLLRNSGINLSMQQLRKMDTASTDTPLPNSIVSFWQEMDIKLDHEAHSCIWQLLFDDCVEAMKFCIARHKYFHKATYRLAASYAASGLIDEALTVLRACFTQKHKYFSVQMWEINDVSLGSGSQKKRSRKVDKAKAGQTLQLFDGNIDKEEQSTFGRDTLVTGVGWEESRRRWVGCIRKYCFLYLKLLSVSVGNGCTLSFKSLEAAALVLHDSASQYPYMQDVKDFAFVHHLIALTDVVSGRVMLKDDLESGADGTEILDKPSKVSLLERAFTWYVDISSRVDCWDTFLESAIKASSCFSAESTEHLLHELGSEAFCGHALAFIVALSSNMDTERLSSIATTLRKKFKCSQHECPTGPLKLCKGLATSLTAAVAAKLGVVEFTAGPTGSEKREAAFVLAHELMAVSNWKLLTKAGDLDCSETAPERTGEVAGGTNTQLPPDASDLLLRLALLISGDHMSVEAAKLYCREITRIKRRGLEEACAAASLAISQAQGNQNSETESHETE